MSPQSILRVSGLFFTFCFILAASVSAREVTIRIVGSGGGARYIEQGQATSLPVSVQVGDTVVWSNEGNRTHTATAEAEDGALLFDTGDIDPGEVSSPITMTAELYAAVGGAEGSEESIGYFCDIHPRMTASLELSERDRDGDDPLRPSRSIWVRRDITMLTAGELTSYRDAWRALQRSGQYADLAGYHGCPQGFCHRFQDGPIFLPWHREYVLRMEIALGQPLHYWDWTATSAASNGIPAAFTERTYVSGDGQTQPNPLRAFRFRCPSTTPARTTSRNPRNPSLLRGFASEVGRSYRQTNYSDFNSEIEDPHGSLHVWVSGNMSGISTAAYDPIFWAHHANVDRQWASWQRGGGPNPSASTRMLPLTGFTPRTVEDVLGTVALGYEYDRYDTMPARRDRAPQFLASAPIRPDGVGKTFAVDIPDRTLAMPGRDAGSSGIDLYVDGIGDHPKDSYFVYVFVNQPDAGVEDAKPDNPNFAGAFGVFGGATHEGMDAANAAPAPPKRVMELFAARKAPHRGPIRQVTLVTTDETGAVVSRDVVPFNRIKLVPSGEGVDAAMPRSEPGRRTFTGVSRNESFDEAYRDAVRQAEAAMAGGGADRRIATRVLSIEGTRGGVAGMTELRVTIRATIE